MHCLCVEKTNKGTELEKYLFLMEAQLNVDKN
jgi:hypothetical protein